MADSKNAKSDAGAAQVQSKVDEWNEKGYRGVGVDPTPNEAYTIAGVTGTPDPTPETDIDAEAEARAAAGVGHGPLAAAEAEAQAAKESQT